jgi:hypothetical protein
MPNPSIKDEALYRDLRKQGDSKEKAARISNAAAAILAPTTTGPCHNSRNAPKSLECPAIRA